MWLVLVAGAIAAAAPKLAVFDLAAVELPAAKGGAFTDHLSAALQNQGFAVTSSRAMASVLSLDRQKELAGCAEAASNCVAELAGALGVDAIVTGSVSRLDQTVHLVSLKLVNAKDGTSMAAFSRTGGSEQAVLTLLVDASDEFSRVLLGRPSSKRASTLVWLPVALGALGAAVGAGLLISTASDAKTLGTATLDLATADRLRSRGKATHIAGWTAVAIAAAAWVAAGALLLFGSTPEVSGSIVPVSGGVLTTLGGEF